MLMSTCFPPALASLKMARVALQQLTVLMLDVAKVASNPLESATALNRLFRPLRFLAG